MPSEVCRRGHGFDSKRLKHAHGDEGMPPARAPHGNQL